MPNCRVRETRPKPMLLNILNRSMLLHIYISLKFHIDLLFQVLNITAFMCLKNVVTFFKKKNLS